MQRILTPVIHCETEEQTLKNVDLLEAAGVHNCFLIGHSLSYRRLVLIYESLKQNYPHFWVGLNFLDLTPEESLQAVPETADALWLDNLTIDEELEFQSRASEIYKMKRENLLLFGGFAFKYQNEVKDLVKVSREASKFCDVPTTSGDATGVAAQVSKIKTIKQAIGKVPLAIASGITPDNVFHYMDYINYYLVATGISRSFTEFDIDKINTLKKNLLKSKYLVEGAFFGILSLGLNENGVPSMSLEQSPNNSLILEDLKKFLLSFGIPHPQASGFEIWLSEDDLEEVQKSPLQHNIKRIE